MQVNLATEPFRSFPKESANGSRRTTFEATHQITTSSASNDHVQCVLNATTRMDEVTRECTDLILTGRKHYATYLQNAERRFYELALTLPPPVKNNGTATEGVVGTAGNFSALFSGLLVNHRNACTDAIRDRSRTYDPAVNGSYPIRSVDGDPIEITAISMYPRSIDGESLESEAYHFENVLPFISSKIDDQTRGRLYSRLQCRPIEQVSRPEEHALVNQNGVFATEPIQEGSCLGPYGGMLVGPSWPAKRTCARVYVGLDEQDLRFVDGDNILSRVNTSFMYDVNGRPYAENPAACNVLPCMYTMALSDGTSINLPVHFSACDIPTGAELRVPYGLTPDQISVFLTETL